MLPVISRLARFACSPHRTRTCLPRLGMIVTGACQGGALLPFALPRALLSSSGLNRPLIETLGYIFHRGRLKKKTDLRKSRLREATLGDKSSVAPKNVETPAPTDHNGLLRVIQFQP